MSNGNWNMLYPCLTSSCYFDICSLKKFQMVYIDYEPIEVNSNLNRDELTYHMHTTESYSDAIVLIKWFNG